ncbi:hypothetical protein [Pectobacterium phage CX5]|uniref:Uncharacterized protein n=1 Tax=Pectobacterium phage CX5 TaxID=2652426 RepID=A0A5P8D3G8_9CAUD|nr:hypothetical protein [Pectobacterium phage CX5]QFP93623.1 hypothetical protein [Pectobacterium phage CX5-1]
MSKTFTGSITVDFKLVMSDEGVVDVDSVLMQTATNAVGGKACFASYAAQLPTVDERMMVTIKRGLRSYVKSALQEMHDDTTALNQGDRFTFSPVTVTVKGQE